MADTAAPDTQTRAGRKRLAEQKGEGNGGSKERAEEVLDKDAERKRLDSEKEPEGRKMDDPIRVLARRAVEIAEAGGSTLGSAITAPQAERVKERLGSDPLAKFKPATATQLQAYAQGGRGVGRADIPEEGITKLRDFCRQMGDRRIWPRKVAALTLAIDEERTGRARPGTRKTAEKEAEPVK